MTNNKPIPCAHCSDGVLVIGQYDDSWEWICTGCNTGCDSFTSEQGAIEHAEKRQPCAVCVERKKLEDLADAARRVMDCPFPDEAETATNQVKEPGS